jgi:hypothetical protein
MMRWIAKAGMGAKMLFARAKSGTQLDDELQDHLERLIAENVGSQIGATDWPGAKVSA